MKYKAGDKTVLGQIISVQIAYPNDRREEDYTEYIVDGKVDNHTFQEFEIDAIIIKPKRNIDHFIELWESGNAKEAIVFFNKVRESRFRTDRANGKIIGICTALFQPYTEPSKYPKLTPEELKAVKWLVEGGFTEMRKDPLDVSVNCRGFKSWLIHSPIAECLCTAKWITTEPINLAELLAAQGAL